VRSPRAASTVYGVATWTAVPTLIQDFFMNPNIGRYDLSSIRRLSGGGAAMPAAVAQRLQDMASPISRAMDSRRPSPPLTSIRRIVRNNNAWDPDLRRGLAGDRSGDAARSAHRRGGRDRHARSAGLPGYWNRPEETAEAFIDLDDKRFLRTGDLGRIDEDGYFFMVDRLKRMINASGFKVWPAEVESLMHRHRRCWRHA